MSPPKGTNPNTTHNVPIELLTTSEVAHILGVTPRRVAQLADQRPDFPQPYAVTRGVKRAQGIRLWHPDDIQHWAATANRDLRTNPGRP